MLTIVPEEESRRWREEVQLLSQSASLEDRVVSILMDLKIGGGGQGGDRARAKAAAILQMLRTPVDLVKAKLAAEISEEVRRMVMHDLRAGCGECHWANEYVLERVKALDKIVQGDSKRGT
jgi:hypothetical protein